MLYSPVADFHCFSLSFGNSVFSVQNVHMCVMCVKAGAPGMRLTQTLLCMQLCRAEPPIRPFPEQPLRGIRRGEGPAPLSKAGAFWAVPSDTELTSLESSMCAACQVCRHSQCSMTWGTAVYHFGFLFITKEK